MKLLRRRKTILVILVFIWLGGMIYFLAPLTGSRDDTRSKGDQEDTHINFQQNTDNRDTYYDKVSLNYFYDRIFVNYQGQCLEM